MKSVILFLFAWGMCVQTLTAADKPNILFIFSDDHAQHAISAYGSKVNQTPHLDRLAKDGARFTNSFVTNSICKPSRATLLTGQYADPSTWPSGSSDGPWDAYQATGMKTVAEAIAITMDH